MRHEALHRIPKARCVILTAIVLTVGSCGGGTGDPDGDPILITVPPGASFATVTDTLASRRLVSRPMLFNLVARVRGFDRGIRAGNYAFQPGASWTSILEDMVSGRVLTVPVTIPEGYTVAQISTRLSDVTGMPEDSILSVLRTDSVDERYEVPGPDLEGYLFPDTYHFSEGTGLDQVVTAMVHRYRAAWTSARQARREELGMTEREVVTLASIIQAEARVVDEMPTISAVYHNRLRLGWPLQADPTVLYALGGHRPRLLFSAMDSVANHPYNTYTNPGLPPGAIGSPGEAALDAALYPLDVDHLFFVARSDGSHVFTRTLAEHNRAVEASRRERRERERQSARKPAEPSPPSSGSDPSGSF